MSRIINENMKNTFEQSLCGYTIIANSHKLSKWPAENIKSWYLEFGSNIFDLYYCMILMYGCWCPKCLSWPYS